MKRILGLPIVRGAINQQDLAFAEVGKNWIATVAWDPSKPGGLDRVFWRTAGTYRILPKSLEVQDTIEVGADDYTNPHAPLRNRLYFNIEDIRLDDPGELCVSLGDKPNGPRVRSGPTIDVPLPQVYEVAEPFDRRRRGFFDK